MYGARWGRDSMQFASSSFLNRSFTGSQYSLRLSTMAMSWIRHVEQARWPISAGDMGCLRLMMQSSQLPCCSLLSYR